MKVKGLLFALLGLTLAGVSSNISNNRNIARVDADASIYSNYYYVQDTNTYVDGGYYFITIDQFDDLRCVASYYLSAATNQGTSVVVTKYENRDEIDKSNLFKFTIGEDGYATITNYENKHLFAYGDSANGVRVGNVNGDTYHDKWTITKNGNNNVLTNHRTDKNRYLAVKVTASNSYISYMPATINGADATNCHYALRLLKYEDDSEKTIKIAFTTDVEKGDPLYGPLSRAYDKDEFLDNQIPCIDYENSSNLDKLHSIVFENCKHGWFSDNTIAALQLGDATWYTTSSYVDFWLIPGNIMITNVSAVMYSYKTNETCYAMINGIRRSIGTMSQATLVNKDANYNNEVVTIAGAKGPTNYTTGVNDDKYGSLTLYSVSITYKPINEDNAVNNFIKSNKVDTQLSFKYDKIDESSYKIYEAGLTYRAQFSDAQYAALKALGTDVTFGLQFLNEGNFTRVECPKNLIEMASKEVAIRISEITNFKTVLTVSAYIEVDGVIYYTMNPAKYSVKSISAIYYSDINDGTIDVDEEQKADVLGCLNIMKVMDEADPWPVNE